MKHLGQLASFAMVALLVSVGWLGQSVGWLGQSVGWLGQSEAVPQISLSGTLLLSGAPLRFAPATPPEVSARSSVFYPARLMANARANAEKHAWAAEIRKTIVRAAEPWMGFSDDQLWDLPFGSTLERSWMVFSSGYCPACKTGVPMYNWQIDALKRPWKVRCPHCQELFPKNDFYRFYRSGLDEHAVFDPERADRKLLLNLEHPDPSDPLYQFGVDDGSGYVEGASSRWRFIGAYLIYGQWKQAIVRGIENLAAAFAVTGDAVYAHKAGVLLDRVADLYPTFDFGKQAILYERRGDRGYVSTWHDACVEVRTIALAYDQVSESLGDDKELTAFLAGKANQHKLGNPKASWADIRRNIEDRILRDTLSHRNKIESNYPQTDVTITVIKTVLDWPRNRDEVNSLIDAIVKRVTAVDGMTGEKGLAGYTTIGPTCLARFLERFARMDPTLLPDLLKRHPQLHQTYRFHIDTWCLGQYYPLSGDTCQFAVKVDSYRGVAFARPGSLEPSGFSFLWRLYELTKDPALVQVLYHANGSSVQGLPHDLLAADPGAFQQQVADVVAREGKDPKLGSVNKQQWHLAILRSGRGNDARAVWLDYDSGGGHGHQDGMNLGLFAKGLDLMPDFGYPPVQYGGWHGPRFNWYHLPSSHNTVVVDGKGQPNASGTTTLWADGNGFRAIRASAPATIGGKQFERTVAMVDLSDHDFYVLDVFRVVGGTDHAKFVHSHFGRIAAEGLRLDAVPEYGHGALMRNFQADLEPPPGWSVDWKVEDRYGYLPAGSEVHLRYTDLTDKAQACVAEGWIVAGIYDSNDETWIPRVMVRRRAATAPLASTFVAVIEPYEKTSNIAQIARLPLQTDRGAAYPDANVAVEVRAADGRRDLFVALDVENPLGQTPSRAKDGIAVQQDRQLRLDGELCLVRWDASGKVTRIALCRGSTLRAGEVTLKLKQPSDFIEIRFDDEQAAVVAGDPKTVDAIELNGRRVPLK